MNITITARKFKIRENLREYILAEVEHLKKFNDEILDAEVILSFQNLKDSIKIAELVVKVPGTVLTATEEAESYEVAVKVTVEKIIRQMDKLKDKKKH